MYLQEVLEVTIGLIFVWLVLAIASMGIQEWIVGILKTRAKDLEKSIKNLLGNEEFAKEFYSHPLIKSLSQKRIDRNGNSKWSLPSYIPKETFAQVLFDMAITAGTDKSVIQSELNKLKGTLSKEGQKAIDRLIVEISNTTFDKVGKEEIGKKLERFKNNNPGLGLDPAITLLDPSLSPTDEAKAMDLLRQGIVRWSQDETKKEFSKLLNGLLTGINGYVKQGEKTIATARTNIEDYFDQTMDRLLGAYKRRSIWVGILIGFIIASFFNADSIMIGSILWKEPTIRSALVKNAEAYKLPDEFDSQNPEEAWKDFNAQFSGLDLPLGWKTITVGTKNYLVPADEPAGVLAWIYKVLGLFISGAAAAQGAPFWFDILKKLTNIRASGINPDEKKKQENKRANS